MSIIWLYFKCEKCPNGKLFVDRDNKKISNCDKCNATPANYMRNMAFKKLW